MFRKKPSHRFVFDYEKNAVKTPCIIVFSIPRCGSTLLYQVIDKLFPLENVFKTHHFVYKKNKMRIVAAYRDFRDVVISRWRTSVSVRGNWSVKPVKLDERTAPERARSEFPERMSDAEAVECAEFVRGQIESNLMPYRGVEQKNILWLRYEDFFENFPFLFGELERFFQTRISAAQRAEIEAFSSLEANRERAGRLRTFNEYDPETQIHGDHVGQGKPGYWKKFLTPAQIEIVHRCLGDALNKFGYEC